ncbi:hypothetical protein ACLKA6_012009 [Drosophila palustris]
MAAKALLDELTVATEAYRSSIISKNPFDAKNLALRQETLGDDSDDVLTSPPAKRQRPAVSTSLVVFGIENVGEFIDKSIDAAGSNFTSRVGSRGAIIFESHPSSAIDAISDLARSMNLMSASVLDTLYVTAPLLSQPALNVPVIIQAGVAQLQIKRQDHVLTARGIILRLGTVLRTRGLNRRSSRAKSAIQAVGLQTSQRIQGSLTQRLLFPDTPPAAIVLPPAAIVLPPAAHSQPPVAQAQPSAVFTFSTLYLAVCTSVRSLTWGLLILSALASCLLLINFPIGCCTSTGSKITSQPSLLLG